MKTIQIGGSDISASRMAYGCWRILGLTDRGEISAEKEAAARASIDAALQAGFTLFDHADIYSDGHAEEVFGRVLADAPELRAKMVIATKCGIRRATTQPAAPYRYDSSREHIVRSCEESLARLRTGHIDIYQIHRPDYLAEPEEIAAAFSQLREQGKVLEFGVSNAGPTHVAALQKSLPRKLVANQVEISLMALERFHDGTLDQCLAERITPMAWSPLAAGRLMFQGAIEMSDPNRVAKQRLKDGLGHIARELGIGRPVAALAWLMRHPSGIVPIVGSANPERIAEAATAAEVELSREDWYRLMEAALGERLP